MRRPGRAPWWVSVGSEFQGVCRLQIAAIASAGSPIEITETMS